MTEQITIIQKNLLKPLAWRRVIPPIMNGRFLAASLDPWFPLPSEIFVGSVPFSDGFSEIGVGTSFTSADCDPIAGLGVSIWSEDVTGVVGVGTEGVSFVVTLDIYVFSNHGCKKMVWTFFAILGCDAVTSLNIDCDLDIPNHIAAKTHQHHRHSLVGR